MKQKLAIARALFHRPALLFLDEPSAGLDPLAAAALHEELTRLVRAEGVTVFLTTHNMSEAAKLCALVGLVRLRLAGMSFSTSLASSRIVNSRGLPRFTGPTKSRSLDIIRIMPITRSSTY